MLAEIIMPKLGDAAEECWIEKWNKSIGETVELGEILCEVSIDKAAYDFESPYSGSLVEILVEPNVVVAPGTPIGRIEVTEEEGI